MSSILGVFAIGPNPAAALVAGGHLVAMAEEERLVRSRDIELAFPAHAIACGLAAGGLAAHELDAVAYAWDATRYPRAMLLGNLGRWLRHNVPLVRRGVSPGDLRYKALINGVELAFHDRAFVRWRLEGSLGLQTFGQALPPVRFVPHHLAHAASAFFCSGFEEAAILTVDRNGEDICACIWEGRGVQIVPRRVYRLPHSLGWFYSGFTDYLGFRPEYQEGHVMGLAAYGEPNARLDALMQQVAPLAADGSYRVDPTYFYHGDSHGHSYTPRMIEAFGPPRLGRHEPLQQRHHDIAFAAQRHLERALAGLARQAVQLTGQRRLCLAGGVALNCVANGRLLDEGIASDLFIQPASNDAGTALGAAQWAAAENGDDPRFTMRHACYGPRYTPEEVAAALEASGLPHARLADWTASAARLLAEGLIVAWFEGALEVGPRALGARSILANPHERATTDRVNAIKGRAPWRPLAPAVLDWAVGEYFEGAAPTPFMTVATTVRPAARERLAAVVHIDGTTRPQVVTQADRPTFYRLIDAFHRFTGTAAIINTSFNVADEPIVCSPADALRTFVTSDLDALAIEGHLVWKPSVAPQIATITRAQAAMAAHGKVQDDPR